MRALYVGGWAFVGCLVVSAGCAPDAPSRSTTERQLAQVTSDIERDPPGSTVKQVSTDEAAAALESLEGRDYPLISAAVSKSKADCMTAAGFVDRPFSVDELRLDVSSPPPGPVRPAATVYEPEIVTSVSDEEKKISDTHESKTAEYRAAAFGDAGDLVSVEIDGFGTVMFPRTGCLAEGKAAVFGSVENAAQYEIITGNNLFEVASRVSSDDAFLAAQGAWSQCMIERGYQFAEFGEAPAQARADPASEQAIFTADHACSKASGLRAAYDDAVERMTTQMLDEQGASIVLINNIGAEAEARARQILDLDDGALLSPQKKSDDF